MKLISLLMLGAACAAAQTVEGTVTNALNAAAIPGAKVALWQNDQSHYSALTDTEGNFRIEDIKPGTYSVRYSHNAYFSPGGGPRDLQPLRIGAAGPPVHLESRLIPLSRVTGRVIDSRGDPVPKASVEINSLSSFWRAETDARGNFELATVIPSAGAYVLSAAAPPQWRAPANDPDTHQPRAWLRTYYPAAAFRDLALPIYLRAGDDLLGIEIKLLAATPHAVRGILLDPAGAPAANVALVLWEPGPRREPAWHATSATDGSFEFPAVPDGEWRLAAASGTALAEQWFALSGRDLDALKLRLSPPFVLTGKVILETRPDIPPPSPPGVTLIRQHSGQIQFQGPSILSATPGPDGAFHFDDVSPGTYRIIPGTPPPQYYLDAPALDEVDLSVAAPTLSIVYKLNGGTVRGAVEKCGTAQIWLVPQTGPRQRIYFAGCDAQARFELSSVRPGDYFALAVPAWELWPGSLDPAILQRAAKLTVRPNEITQADLALSTLR